MSATAPPTTTLSRLSAADFPAAAADLAGLLADTVADGASLGFLSPFGHAEAAAWWTDRVPAVAGGSLLVWLARDASPASSFSASPLGGVAADAPAAVGTVSLALESRPNGRHRAEVVKLMVHPSARGRGLARALLATAEAAAAAVGADLLLLDTETDSSAEHLYRSAGWTRYGVVPGYAADPHGTLRDCSFFYKRPAPAADRPGPGYSAAD